MGMGMDSNLEAEILAKIGEHAHLAQGAISRATDLQELGIHSLELTEIIFDIEERYGIEVQMDTAQAWDRLKNVGDIIDAVNGLIRQKA
jgi:nodulation protein F